MYVDTVHMSLILVAPCEGSRESFQNIISSVEIDEQHKSMTTSNS